MASTFTGLQTRRFSFVPCAFSLTGHRLDSLSGDRIFFRFRQVRKENEPINFIMYLSVFRHKKTEFRNTSYLIWYFVVLLNFSDTDCSENPTFLMNIGMLFRIHLKTEY
jgi:hypothetical protein